MLRTFIEASKNQWIGTWALEGCCPRLNPTAPNYSLCDFGMSIYIF